MRRPSGKLLLKVALGAALLVGGRLVLPEPSLKQAPAPAQQAKVSAWRWSATVEATRRQTLTAGAPALTMRLGARMLLDVRQLDERSLEVRVAKLESFEGQVNGTSAQTPALEGLVAQVELSPSGSVVGLSTAPGAPDALGGVLRVLFSEAQLSWGQGAAWQSREDTESGSLLASYTRTEDGQGGALVEKRWEVAEGGPSFSKVAGGARFVVAADGVIDELGAERTLLLEGPGRRLLLESNVKVQLRRGRQAPWALAPMATTLAPPQPLSASRSAPASREELLRQRASGMTLADVTSTLPLEASLTGEARDTFLLRASALLMLEPATAFELQQALASPELPVRARLLGFELLASAGTVQAQASMVALLEQAALRPGQEKLVLMERLIAVRHPEKALVDFVQARMQDARGRDFAAVAMVLGALASRLEPEEQQRLVDWLGAQLQSATELEAIGLVRALGNVGSMACRGLLVAQAREGSTGRRQAAASALRKLTGEEVEAALLALACDEVPSVQRAALETLMTRPAHPPTLQGLALAEAEQRLGQDAQPALLNLVSRWQAEQPALAARVLDAALARKELPSTLRARALELRRRLDGPVP